MPNHSISRRSSGNRTTPDKNPGVMKGSRRSSGTNTTPDTNPGVPKIKRQGGVGSQTAAEKRV